MPAFCAIHERRLAKMLVFWCRSETEGDTVVDVYVFISLPRAVGLLGASGANKMHFVYQALQAYRAFV